MAAILKWLWNLEMAREAKPHAFLKNSGKQRTQSSDVINIDDTMNYCLAICTTEINTSPCDADLGWYKELYVFGHGRVANHYNVNIPVSYTKSIQEFLPSFHVLLILSPKVQNHAFISSR